MLAVMRDGSVVQAPEPAAEAVEKIDMPAVGGDDGAPDWVFRARDPASCENASYWSAREGWYWATASGSGGPFATFDEAVADRWRWLR